jgi:transcriptional regulator with XRE-family HTH domain
MAFLKDRKQFLQPEFENRLRNKRQALGLSQQQLAALTGITRQAVSAVESSQYSPATSVALQLARARLTAGSKISSASKAPAILSRASYWDRFRTESTKSAPR